MLYKKKGFPRESEIIICTVTKVQYNSVFVNLDEYGKSGIIHISEISPGRIRNIRDYVKEDKKIICKVLRVNEERGHIDLSLRRVTEVQKRAKNELIKHEQMAEKMLELFSKDVKKPVEKLYLDIMTAIKGKYDSLYDCFEAIATGNENIKIIGLEKKLADKLEVMIKQRIVPPEVAIGGVLTVTSYASDGVEVVKEALSKAKDIELRYLGGGRYTVNVKAEDYKTAEEILKKAIDPVISFIQEKGGVGNFERTEA